MNLPSAASELKKLALNVVGVGIVENALHMHGTGRGEQVADNGREVGLSAIRIADLLQRLQSWLLPTANASRR